MSDKKPTEDSKPDRKPVSVLFVCLGNICRSTMAEGVFRSLTSHPDPGHPLISRIDSAGTGAWHIGSAPDRRTLATLRSKNMAAGYVHRGRQVGLRDFEEFDWLMAMDEENEEDLLELRRKVVRKRRGKGAGAGAGAGAGKADGEEGLARVALWGEFAPEAGKREIVEDPYYGGDEGFEVAWEQCVRFGKEFLRRVEEGELG